MSMFNPEDVQRMAEQFQTLARITAGWQEALGQSPFGEVAKGEVCESTTDDDSFWEE